VKFKNNFNPANFHISNSNLEMKRDQNINKRTAPSDVLLDWREEYLKSIKSLKFNKTFENAPLLEIGNSKIGQWSEYYDKVFVWNLPVVLTCPGASQWCLRHCYNADKRHEKFPIDSWHKNLQFFLEDKKALAIELLKILTQENGRVAVRIHSSGDFFSNEYINFWKDLINKTPDVNYWAYTRSWVKPALSESLNELKKSPNLQLFASWDNTMPQAPPNWRKSIVYSLKEPISNNGIICPEQSGKSPNCATCNYCIKKNKGDVYFILH
jgi:hypothetical protein